MKDRKSLIKFLTPIIEESKIYDNDNQFIEVQQNVRFKSQKVGNINQKQEKNNHQDHRNSQTYSWLYFKPRKQRGKSNIQQRSNIRADSLYQQNQHHSLQKPNQTIQQNLLKKDIRNRTEGLYQQQQYQKYLEKTDSFKKFQKMNFHLPKIFQIKNLVHNKAYQNVGKNLDQKDRKIISSKLISTLTLQQQQTCNQAKLQLFQDIFRTMPKQPHLRNEENSRKFVYKIHKSNPFFKRLEYLTVVQFIKNCDILTFKAGQTIFAKNTNYLNSMIILWGSVQIFDKNLMFQKIYQIGSTLNQEYFFQNKTSKKKKIQIAKALQNTGILQLNNKKLALIKSALVRLYLLIDLKKIQSIFKKNYLQKCSRRNMEKYKLKQDL